MIYAGSRDTGAPISIHPGAETALEIIDILARAGADPNRAPAGEALIDITIRTCNGRLTATEALGHREFVLTKLYRSA